MVEVLSLHEHRQGDAVFRSETRWRYVLQTGKDADERLIEHIRDVVETLLEVLRELRLSRYLPECLRWASQ